MKRMRWWTWMGLGIAGIAVLGLSYRLCVDSHRSSVGSDRPGGVPVVVANGGPQATGSTGVSRAEAVTRDHVAGGSGAAGLGVTNVGAGGISGTDNGLPAMAAKDADPYSGCEVVAERMGTVDAAGRHERVRVYRTTGKYPLIRVVDTMGKGSGFGVLGSGRGAPPSVSGSSSATHISRMEMVADHITVKLATGQTESDLKAICAKQGVRILRKLRTGGNDMFLVQLPAAGVDSVPEAVAAFKKEVQAVAYAEPDYVVRTLETVPSDPEFWQLWALRNSNPTAASVLQGGNNYVSQPMMYSGHTPTFGTSGKLYFCGYGGTMADFPPEVNGNIALIERGGDDGHADRFTFATKVTNAKAAGAVAVVIFNDYSIGDYTGTLVSPGDWLPAVSMARAPGLVLKALGAVDATVIATVNTRGDVSATLAWDESTGSRNVLVGVIDTGVDYTHPDLESNMWQNVGETGLDGNGNDKRYNRIDDDGNGYVDDWRGWDFCNDDNNSMDDHGHGTHVSGTIGGVGNNGIGVAGVCWSVSIVGLKFLSGQGEGMISDAMEATWYATKIGCKLTSNSWGGGPYDQGMHDAIEDAKTNNMLFVAAAGNATANNDEVFQYPASFDCENIIAVAATDWTDTLAAFSSYGLTTVDLAAPGVATYSCAPGGGYRAMSGTSMATPHVAGACALMWSSAPGLSAAQVKSNLLATVDPVPALAGRCVTGGRMNVWAALLSASPAAHLSYDGHTVNDGAPGGDGDSIVNPGETVDLTVTVKNMGAVSATGVVATISTTDSYVTVTDATATIGDVSGGRGTKTALDPFTMQVAAGCPTPHTVTLNMTARDSGTNVWNTSFTVMVYFSSHISGTVRLDGNPQPGVRVGFVGPISGSVPSATNGAYLFGGVAGDYWVVAQSNTWLDTPTVRVTVPPATSGVDFAFTSATVSGRITETLTGDPIAGATVSYAGALSGMATSDADGRYRFTRVYGRATTLRLTARHPSYFDSFPLAVTVPGDATNVDFRLGVPDIRVSPSSFDVTVNQGEVTNCPLAITNVGGAQLKWGTWIEGAQGVTPAGALLNQFPVSTNEYFYPFGVAYDGTSLWVAGVVSYGAFLARWTEIKQVDPVDGHLISTLNISNICVQPYGMTWDGSNLWIAGEQDMKLHAVNPQTGLEVKTLDSPNGCPIGVAWDGEALWVKTWFEGDVKTLYRVNVTNGAVIRTIPVPTNVVSHGIGLTYLNGDLFMGGFGSDQIHKISSADGSWLSSFTNPSGQFPIDMCDDGQGGLWVLDYVKWTLSRMTGGEASWLSAVPHDGAVPSTNSITAAVGFDSRKAKPGVQNANLHLISNDPDQPDIVLPAKLTVVTPHTVSGTVLKDGVPMAGATLSCTGPHDGSLQAEADGTYRLYASTGTYNIVAGYTGYLSSAAATVTIPPSQTNVDFEFITASVSGHVTDTLTGLPVADAEVVYGGGLTGSVMAAGDGSYSFTRVFGRTETLSVRARKPGVYYDSAPLAVTVPGSVSNADLHMGIPDAGLSVPSLNVTGGLHEAISRTVAITNRGGHPVEWSLWDTPTQTVRAVAAGTVKREISLGLGVKGNWTGIAYDRQVLWASTDWDWRYIYTLNPTNGALLRVWDIQAALVYPWGMAYDGKVVWVAGINNDTGKVFGVDPRTGAMTANYTLPGGVVPISLAWLDGFLWVNANDKRIYKMDPDDGSIKGSSAVPVSGYVYALTGFKGALWMMSIDPDGRVYKVNPATGAILRSFTAPEYEVIALGSDGVSALWVTGHYCVSRKAYLVETGEATWLACEESQGSVPTHTAGDVTFNFSGLNAGLGTNTLTVQLLSNDPDTPKIMIPVTYTVTNDNRAAQITGFSPETPFNMPTNVSQTFEITAGDPDDDPLSYSWRLDGSPISGATGTSHAVSFAMGGPHTLVATADDGWGGATSQTWAITVNMPPVVQGASPASPANVRAGTTQEFSVAVWDLNGDALSYEWRVDAVVQEGATGTNFAYAPANPGDVGTHTNRVIVSDGHGGVVTNDWLVQVGSASSNAKPLITGTMPASPVTIHMGLPERFALSATDPDGDPLTTRWQVDGAHQGGVTNMTFDYAPGLGDVGVRTLRAIVQDGYGGAATNDWDVTVDLLSRNTMKISFPGYTRSETLTNFPVLVKFAAGITNGFSYDRMLSSEGWDLRFWDETESVPLNYEIETWNTNAESFVWVQVPALSSDTFIWATWGDAADCNQSVCTTNGATWTNGFTIVGHLAETGGTVIRDSTANHNNGTATNGVVVNVAGKVGQGEQFDGANDYTQFGTTARPADNFTFSAWIKTSATHENDPELNMGTTGTTGQKYAFDPTMGGGSTAGAGLSIGNNGIGVYEHSGGYMPPLAVYGTAIGTDWNYVSVVYIGRRPTIYLNGVYARANYASAKAPVYAPYIIGGVSYGCLAGSMDEARVSSVARSTNWVWAEYMNMASNAAFNTCGPVAGMLLSWNGAGVTNVTTATVEGFASLSGANSDVYLFWDTADRGLKPALWANTNFVGAGIGTGLVSGVVMSNLTAGQSYVCRFYATNATYGATAWSASVGFAMQGPPQVKNADGGATGVTVTAAWLNGTLVSTGASQTAWGVLWGTNNPGATMAGWLGGGAVDFGTAGGENISTSRYVTGLSEGKAYYYTYWASNSAGLNVATPVSFTMCRIIAAMGGNVTTNDGYITHTFKTVGVSNLTITSGGKVEVLVVAGGGGGGQNGGGGGGAGGLRYTNSIAVTNNQVVSVTVGGGGAAATDGSHVGGSGGSSAFGTLSATGGGGGASRDGGGQASAGGSGGGGGGAKSANGTGYLAGSGTSGQGNNGGNGTAPDLATSATGGGGGGAGGPGTGGVSQQAGSGGTGLQYTNFAGVGGSPAGWFAGGGAGGVVVLGSNGVGGTNGGGGNVGVGGAANTGGGGGAGAAGGSGIVIVRYPVVEGNPDADGDGMPDEWEIQYFGGTNEANGAWHEDWDGDRMNNLDEYIAGTNPTNANSRLQVSWAGVQDGTKFVIHWSSVTGKWYGIRTTTNLSLGFADLVTNHLPATPVLNVHTVTVDQAGSRFYRVTIEP